jgi:hypothetical protein
MDTNILVQVAVRFLLVQVLYCTVLYCTDCSVQVRVINISPIAPELGVRPLDKTNSGRKNHLCTVKVQDSQYDMNVQEYCTDCSLLLRLFLHNIISAKNSSDITRKALEALEITVPLYDLEVRHTVG